MSRRYGMTHTNARAVSLADFGFALILPGNSHAHRGERLMFTSCVVRTAMGGRALLFLGRKVLDHLGLIVILPLLTQLKLIRIMVSIIKLV
jgi:hypothetical protein